MKFLKIIILCCTCTSIFAMDLSKQVISRANNEDLFGKVDTNAILEALKQKKPNYQEIGEQLKNLPLFYEKQKEQPTRGKKSNQDTKFVDFFEEAKKQAQANVDGAKKQLTWSGNTGRRNQLALGCVGVIMGLAKGAYDLFAFSTDTTEPVQNGFNLATDATTVLGGGYLIKLACQNNGPQSAYGEAVSALRLIEAQEQTYLQFKEMSQNFKETIQQLEKKLNAFSNPDVPASSESSDPINLLEVRPNSLQTSEDKSEE